MATYSQLKRRQLTLKGQVSALLDEFLIGSVSTKGPKRPGFNLTYNVDQITKSRHVRKDLEKRVIRMWRLLAFRPENENWWSFVRRARTYFDNEHAPDGASDS